MLDRVYKLPQHRWEQAYVLALARMKANDGKRGESQDRGSRAVYVDLQGCMGELAMLILAKHLDAVGDAVKSIGEQLLSFEGGAGMKAPDVTLDGEGSLGVDSKLAFVQRNYRYFAINARKHELLRGNASYYACFLCAPFGERLLSARLVPHADVDGWAQGGLRAGGTASRHILLTDFAIRYSKPGELAALVPTYDEVAVRENSLKEQTRLALNELYSGLGDKVWTMLKLRG